MKAIKKSACEYGRKKMIKRKEKEEIMKEER